MDTGFIDIDRPNPRPMVYGPGTGHAPCTSTPELDAFIKKLEEDIKQDESICEEAHRIVNTARDQAYGTPLSNFTRIAKLWSVILGIDVTPEQVGLCMALLKFAREVNKHKRDNLIDAAGYLECVQMVIDEKAKING